MGNKSKKLILWLKELSKNDIPLVGGKNASLGEMYNQLFKKGINIPDGFALTTKAYWYFLKENKGKEGKPSSSPFARARDLEEKLKEIFVKFNPKSIKSLQETGKAARELILRGELPE
ncbi:MAG: PEP/pyruvate-binding domain-containing protein, partial [bacterium]|nr:PEP/pyruvate-binding domain-containing protein [bacterium]